MANRTKSSSKWVCNSCGETFTRGTSCRRHIANKHFGYGAPVRDMEYVIGRLSGVFAAPSNSATTASIGQYQIGPRPSFMPNTLSATAANQSQLQAPANKKEEASLLDRALDQFWIEYYGEMGRIAARRSVNPSPTTLFSPVAIATSAFTSSVNPYGYHNAYAWRSRFYSYKGNELFGISVFNCGKCNSILPRTTFFSPGEKGSVSYVLPHLCCQELIKEFFNSESSSHSSSGTHALLSLQEEQEKIEKLAKMSL